VTIAPEQPRDPWAPRPIDRATDVPLDGPLDVLDAAKILAAPDDPDDWPAWRDALTRWRLEASARVNYDGGAYERPELSWTQSCFAVALAWLWDELLYAHEARRFTPERFCDHADAEFGGLDGIVLWHAYPVIGIDERNQFDFYRDVLGIEELVRAFRDRGIRVFLDYNPWDIGTRREPVDDDAAIAELVRELDADGVFLDTMKEARPGLRVAVDAARPGIAFEGESTVPLARIRDHHLSWAQWFSDSPVPGVLRARWFEQRHMLHHTRRWNRDHLEELQSAWLNGVGVLVWENVFGSWVGWNDRDKALLRAMLPLQRRHAQLLATGEWTPLAAHGGGAAPPTVVASRWTAGDSTLWAVVNTGDDAFAGPLVGADVELEVPAGGIAAVVDGDQVMATPGGESTSFPRRLARRVAAPVARNDVVSPRAQVATCNLPGFVEVPAPLPQMTAMFRRRETGTYGEAPYIEEWKPLPPRLHDFVEVPRAVVVARRYAIARREVTNAELGADGPPDAPATRVDLAEARAYAASVGARLPTEDEWQLAAEAGLLERAEPLVWNWTESEHTDGRTRFAILKGGSAWRAEGSDWYVDGGPQEPRYSLKLLLMGPLSRSSRIGFRLAVDLE
jgi:sulfatase modifying factor 1